MIDAKTIAEWRKKYRAYIGFSSRTDSADEYRQVLSLLDEIERLNSEHAGYVKAKECELDRYVAQLVTIRDAISKLDKPWCYDESGQDFSYYTLESVQAVIDAAKLDTAVAVKLEARLAKADQVVEAVTESVGGWRSIIDSLRYDANGPRHTATTEFARAHLPILEAALAEAKAETKP